MLTVSATASPPRRNGLSTAAMIRPTMSLMAGSPSTSSHTTMNSSPAKRATVSVGRRTARSRSASATRSRSPAAWPWVSLISLKRSTSRKSTPRLRRPGAPSGASPGSGARGRRIRFGRPVSGSCRRRWVSSTVVAWWTVTSVALSTAPSPERAAVHSRTSGSPRAGTTRRLRARPCRPSASVEEGADCLGAVGDGEAVVEVGTLEGAAVVGDEPARRRVGPVDPAVEPDVEQRTTRVREEVTPHVVQFVIMLQRSALRPLRRAPFLHSLHCVRPLHLAVTAGRDRRLLRRRRGRRARAGGAVQRGPDPGRVRRRPAARRATARQPPMGARRRFGRRIPRSATG